jgi:hypothetical protein
MGGEAGMVEGGTKGRLLGHRKACPEFSGPQDGKPLQPADIGRVASG